MKDDFLDSQSAPAQGLFLLNESDCCAYRQLWLFTEYTCLFCTLFCLNVLDRKELLQSSSFPRICPTRWWVSCTFCTWSCKIWLFSSDDKPLLKPTGVIFFTLGVFDIKTFKNCCQNDRTPDSSFALNDSSSRAVGRTPSELTGLVRFQTSWDILATASGCNHHRQLSVAGGQRWMGKRRSPAVWKMLPPL